ncbi:hypothetical protein BCD67_05225 [Oscillatoriales cyanobacterium USR001]|nr:hypothetical protein BCD67_05225 [Oscillatoriales cyanobacterium USR001]
MKTSTELQNKQETRLQELINIARQRYLDAGGDPRRCPSGRKGDDYMTDEEREEAMLLMRQSAGIRIVGDEVHCQGKSWKLPTNSPLKKEPV